MLNAKHSGTVEGERSLVPPASFLSHTLSVIERVRERLGPELHEARFFHHQGQL